MLYLGFTCLLHRRRRRGRYYDSSGDLINWIIMDCYFRRCCFLNLLLELLITREKWKLHDVGFAVNNIEDLKAFKALANFKLK